MNKSAAILEITGELPQVKSVSYANSISSKLHGIPKDLDIAKRKLAQDILASDKDLQLIFFLCQMVICIWKNHIPVNRT